jgi:hypothetical protein
LVQEVFKHIQAQQVAEQAPVYVDPRFVELSQSAKIEWQFI